MKIHEISNLNNEVERFLDIYKQDIRDIVLYGAGQGADWVMRLFSQFDIYPKKIVDRVGKGIKNGVEIINYDKLLEIYKNGEIYIIIASPRYQEEIINIVSCDFEKRDIFCFECELYCSYINNIIYTRGGV